MQLIDGEAGQIGSGERESDPRERRADHRATPGEEPGDEVRPESPAGPIIRIHPERVISFGVDETDVAASLTVNARNVG